jgi:hypothetical protein
MGEGEERPSRWEKGIVCLLCRKGEKMDCTDFMGLLYILLLTEHCPKSYIIDIECMLILRMKNASVGYIKADQLSVISSYLKY